jgi:acyl dehydratase
MVKKDVYKVIKNNNHSKDKVIDIDDLMNKEAICEFLITNDSIDNLANLSGDHSNIHVCDNFAQKRNFRQRVVHGALLVSCISAVVGMELPGHSSLIQSVNVKFLKPCYAGDSIKVKIQIIEVYASVETVIANVFIFNNREEKILKGKVQIGITNGNYY